MGQAATACRELKEGDRLAVRKKRGASKKDRRSVFIYLNMRRRINRANRLKGKKKKPRAVSDDDDDDDILLGEHETLEDILMENQSEADLRELLSMYLHDKEAPG
jgi:hypothetical protein